MFDFGWSEIAVIAVLALIVIGPKDLPKVLRTIGKWVRKIRAIGGEFQKQMDDVMRESGADEVRKQVTSIARTDIGGKIDKAIDPDGSVAKALREDPTTKPMGKSSAGEEASTGEVTSAVPPEQAAPQEQSGREPETTSEPKAKPAEQQQ